MSKRNERGQHRRYALLFRGAFLTLTYVLAVANTPAHATTTCVNNAAGLQTALSTAGSNGQADTIQVEQGTYLTPGSVFSYGTAENYDLEVLGGYTNSCAGRVLDPTNTILDGQGANQVISLYGGTVSNSGNLTFRGFTVQNGYVNNTNDRGAGASIGGSAGYSGDVAIEFNIFKNNVNTIYYGGGVNASADLGTLRFSNNLVVNNSAKYIGGIALLTNGTAAYITNNTIAGNIDIDAPDPFPIGGLSINGSAPITLSNNILWGNTSPDLKFSGSNKVLVNNDVGTQTGTNGAGSSGNVSVDPKFVGSGDYHLRPDSPAINGGTNSPAGGLPSQDLEGSVRISAGTVDMGAYEYTLLVCDIQMSQTTYTAGDTVTATVYRFANLGPDPVPVEAKGWIGIPSGPPTSSLNVGADGSISLPAGFDQDFGPVTLFPALGMPTGAYELSCRLLDPVTGVLLAEDLNPFVLQ